MTTADSLLASLVDAIDRLDADLVADFLPADLLDRARTFSRKGPRMMYELVVNLADQIAEYREGDAHYRILRVGNHLVTYLAEDQAYAVTLTRRPDEDANRPESGIPAYATDGDASDGGIVWLGDEAFETRWDDDVVLIVAPVTAALQAEAVIDEADENAEQDAAARSAVAVESVYFEIEGVEYTASMTFDEVDPDRSDYVTFAAPDGSTVYLYAPRPTA